LELENKVEERTKELKQAQVQLIHASKLASLGEMVAGIAHEINNPVGFIQGNLDFMKQTINENRSALSKDDTQTVINELAESVEISIQGTQRIKSIVEQLRNFSKLHQTDFKKINVHQEMDTVLDLFFKQHPEIQIECQFDPALDVLLFSCIAEEINLCWYNILINAVQAIHDGEEDHVISKGDGKIIIKTELVNPNTIRIAIRDNGTGMSKDVQAKIFDPFFTTRRIGLGRGLGLTETYGIIQKHQGVIEVHSEKGRGTEFMVTLPIKNN
jgi:signal transduction histidine kinase